MPAVRRLDLTKNPSLSPAVHFHHGLLGALAGLLCASPLLCAGDGASAPQTRREKWRELREEKRGRLSPYEPGWLEHQILLFEKAERPSIFDLHFMGFYPRVRGLAKGSRNAAGVRMWHSDIGGSPLDVQGSAFYSIERYELYDLQVGVIPSARADDAGRTPLPPQTTHGDDVFELAALRVPSGAGWGLFASARYAHSTQLPYFGLGSDSRAENQTTFLSREARYDLVAARSFGRNAYASLSVGYVESGIGPGEDTGLPSTDDLFEDADTPALSSQPEYWRLGAVAMLDGRDAVHDPKRGGVLAFELGRYSDRNGGAYSFSRYAVDARAFLTLGSPQRILALRSYATIDDADPGAEVPFYMQETLGGSHTLRGFPNFRFRGAKLALLQAEYRWEAVPAVQFAVFVDSGTVSGPDRQLDLGALRTSWGVGLRLKTPTTFLARVEWATSDEDSRFYVRFSPAW